MRMTEDEARRKIAAARELLDMSEKLIGHDNYSYYNPRVINAESLRHYRIAINRLLLDIERAGQTRFKATRLTEIQSIQHDDPTT